MLCGLFLVHNIHAEESSFEDKNEALGMVKLIQMPTCDNQDFEAKIHDAAEKYFENEPAYSTISKRKKLLRLKNLKNFEKISAEGFSPNTDFNTANALIMIKINEHVDTKDILLCREKQKRKNTVYVIAYPYLDNVKVHIINLSEKDSNYNAVSFVYP